MTITKEDYIKALITIDEYHRQNNVINVKPEYTLEEWINFYHPRGKLKNILRRICLYTDIKYVSEITEHFFLSQQGAGDTSWRDLNKMLYEISEEKKMR